MLLTIQGSQDYLLDRHAITFLINEFDQCRWLVRSVKRAQLLSRADYAEFRSVEIRARELKSGLETQRTRVFEDASGESAQTLLAVLRELNQTFFESPVRQDGGPINVTLSDRQFRHNRQYLFKGLDLQEDVLTFLHLNYERFCQALTRRRVSLAFSAVL